MSHVAEANPRHLAACFRESVGLVTGLLAVVAGDRWSVPHPGDDRPGGSAVNLHVRTQADDQHDAGQRALESTPGRSALVEIRDTMDHSPQRRRGLELFDHESHGSRIGDPAFCSRGRGRTTTGRV